MLLILRFHRKKQKNRDGGRCDRSDSESCGVNCSLIEQETVTGQYTITEGEYVKNKIGKKI